MKSEKGVKEVNVNFANKKATIVFDKEKIQPLDLKKAVQSVGYDLEIPSSVKGVEHEMMDEHQQQHHHHEEMEYSSLKRNTLGAFILTIPVFILGMFFHHTAGFKLNLLSFILTGIILFGW